VSHQSGFHPVSSNFFFFPWLSDLFLNLQSLPLRPPPKSVLYSGFLLQKLDLWDLQHRGTCFTVTVSPWVSTYSIYIKEKENLFTFCVVCYCSKCGIKIKGGHQTESYHIVVLSCFTDRIISKQISSPGKK